MTVPWGDTLYTMGGYAVSMPGDPGWTGPEWDDPTLTRLARRLREAHRLVEPFPPAERRRLIRHLLAITDLAKRDPGLAARRLEAFLDDFEDSPTGGL